MRQFTPNDHSEYLQDTAQMSSPLLLFRSGTDAPPFFMTHGLGGSVMELRELISHLQIDHPIYGIQWKGLDGSEEPNGSIGDMAEYFIDAIQRVQPNGPYLLAGLSVGGLIMLEVATRLSERGENVALLAFLDTYPHSRYWPLASWIESLSHRVKLQSSALLKMPPSRAISHFAKLCRNLPNHLRARRGEAVPGKYYVQDDDPPALQRLRNSAIEAYSQYEPRYYPGKITFLKAEMVGRFPSDPAKIWSKLARKLEIHAFSCNHVAMITTDADKVAAQLSLCLERALQSSSQRGF